MFENQKSSKNIILISAKSANAKSP